MSSVTPVADSQRLGGKDHRWLILVIVAIAQLMVVLDSTVVNIALPSAQRALDFPNSDRQWVVTAYALAFGSLLLVGGRLGDMFSRKRVFITGLIGFALSSALGGAATSFGMLVAARTLQGAFGAILAPAALGTLVATFRDPRERGRAFGVFGSVAGGGGAVGLILGGVLTQYFSWRWTLYVNLIPAAIAVAGALVYIATNRPDVRPRMDWAGAVLASTGLFALVFGFSHAELAGWTAALTIGSLVAGVILLAGFVFAESRVAQPLLPLRVVLDRARGGSYLSVGLAGIAIFGIFLFLTYYLQEIKGYSPVTSGLAFLPMIACILLSSNISSIVLLQRVGPRALIVTGMLLGGGAMAYLTQLTVTSSYATSVVPALVAMGLGFGMIFAPAINTATAGVARRDSGVASALVNTMQQVGGSIGTAALSTVALTATTSYLVAHHASPGAAAAAAVHGYTVAFTVSAALFGIGALVAGLLLPSRRKLEELRNAEPTVGAGPEAECGAGSQCGAGRQCRAGRQCGAGGQRGRLSSRESQRARSSISRSMAWPMALVKGTSWWMALTRRTPALRSAWASSLPTRRSPDRIGQGVVAPAAGGGGLVHLQLVVEPEQVLGARAVVDEAVERGQQGRAPGEGLAELGRVDPPDSLGALDGGGLPGVADGGRLDRVFRALGAGEAEGAQAALVADPAGLLGRDHRVVGVDAFGQVPDPVVAAAAGYGDLAAGDHEVQHAGDVAVVGPAGGLPGDLAGVRELAGRQGAGGGQAGQDVAAEGVIGADPVAVGGPPAGHLAAAAFVPAGHVGAVQREVLGRADQGQQLDQGPGLAGRRPGRWVSRRSRGGSRRPGRRSGRRRRPGRAAAGSGGGRYREDLQGVSGPGAGRGRRCGGRRRGRAGGRPPGLSYRPDWAAWRDRPSTKISMRSSKRSSGSARANSSARSVMVGKSAEGSEAM